MMPQQQFPGWAGYMMQRQQMQPAMPPPAFGPPPPVGLVPRQQYPVPGNMNQQQLTRNFRFGRFPQQQQSPQPEIRPPYYLPPPTPLNPPKGNSSVQVPPRIVGGVLGGGTYNQPYPGNPALNPPGKSGRN